MTKRFFLGFVGVVGVGIIISFSFLVGFQVGARTPQVIAVSGVENLHAPSSSTAAAADFGVFWQAWKLLEDRHLHGVDVKSQEKVYGSIRGLVSSLHDPYTEFFSPKDGERFQEDVEGNFGGIGAEIGIRHFQLVVIAPLKNTPAEHSGLQAGDQILLINGTSTEGVPLEQAVGMIRGPAKTTVTLMIMREGWEKPREFSIVRDRIVVPTLDYKMLDGDIAYIQLYSFNGNAEELFAKAADDALARNARGVLLDLRNNPGGYLEVAVELAGWFVPRGSIVVSEATRAGVTQQFKAAGSNAFSGLPVVVLVNGGSASASEILAGALRDHVEAKLVGEQSFGKGTVQQVETLKDGSSMKVTVAHWVLPSGKTLEHEGLKPDVEVKITDADIEQKKDVQFERAVEILRREIP